MQGYSRVNGSIRGKVEKGGLFAALSSLRRLHNYCGSTFFSQKLLAGRVQLDQKIGGVDAVHKLVIPQFNIAVARVTGSKGKIFLRVQAGTDGIFQHTVLGKAGQIAVGAQILPQLLNLDTVGVLPQHVVQLHQQQSRCPFGDESLALLHFAGSLCYDAVGAAGNAAGVPLDGFHIHKTIDLRGQQPAVGLLDAGLYGIIAAVKVCVHLFVLGGIEIQRFLVILNGAPCRRESIAS